jgi:hypothetical protein
MCDPCHGCGSTADTTEIDVQPVSPGDTASPWPRPAWRQATVCPDCLERLDAAMWISRRCWESIRPATPFDRLPLLPETP